jgi:aryl-alcohol dehydrogenase-like predicted oxidoreductase
MKRTARTKRTADPASAGPAPTEELAGIALPGGLTHPPVGVGLWALGRWKPEDEARTKATIGRALERGIRWFDTAEVYGSGRSERVLGDVLSRAGSAAASCFLVTKVSWEHLRPRQVRAALLGSLQRLGRPQVDELLLHAPDPHVPIAESMHALEGLLEEGKIRSIGVSNFSVDQLQAANDALGKARIVVDQVRYNLMDRTDGDEIREYCQANGILIEAYTPLARGLLAGRYLDGQHPSSEVKQYSHRLFEEDRFPLLRARAQKIRDLASEAGVPMASIALHWLAERGAAPVVGVSRPEQVDDLLTAWGQRPSEEVLERADAIARGDSD